MTVQLIRKVRDRQPRVPVPIDWGNPITRGLVIDFIPSSYVDAVNQNHKLVLGAGHGSIEQDKLKTVAGGTSSTTYGTNAEIAGKTEFTTLVIATPQTPTVRGALWSSSGTAGGGPGFGCGYTTPSKIYAYVDDGSTYVVEGGTNVFIAGERAVFCWVYNYSATPKNVFWKNGRIVHSENNTGASTGPSATATSLLLGGNHNTGTSLRTWVGSQELTLIWNRALTETEMKHISANPWQVFEPETIPLFYSATGGGATNLSIFDALHSHAGDNLAFSLDTYLAAQDSTHAHASDNLTLNATTAISLVLSDSLHGLSSDVIALITGSYLQVADALHGHSADALTLATASFLAVAEALHAHAADNLTLDTSNATPLTTQGSTHAHSVDNTVFTLDTWLAIVEAVHTHSADNVSISSEELLAVADALHSLASDALVLTLPSPPGTCPTAAEIAAAIIAAAQVTPIYADIRKVNNLTVDGTGTDGDPWGPV